MSHTVRITKVWICRIYYEFSSDSHELDSEEIQAHDNYRLRGYHWKENYVNVLSLYV